MIRTALSMLAALMLLTCFAGCGDSSYQSEQEDEHAAETRQADHDDLPISTHITPEMAQAFGLETELADSAVIRETATLYGRVVPNQERVREVQARFEGAVQSVEVSLGDRTQRGQALARVESNDSLQSYTISAPISGVVTQRNVNPGEQSAGRTLFTIIDSSSVWVELAVFPAERPRVQIGTTVRVTNVDGNVRREGEITFINTVAEPNQSVLVRAVLDNVDGAFMPGSFVKGELQIAEHPVALAVRRRAIQSFRDRTVVFAKVNDEYEARALELGRQDDQWAEVRSGLEPASRYVTTNSYLVKADIEKAGAVHEH